MTKRILKIAEVEFMTSLSRPRIYALMKQGLFPSNIKLTPAGRAVGWLESDIQAFLDERIEASKASV